MKYAIALALAASICVGSATAQTTSTGGTRYLEYDPDAVTKTKVSGPHGDDDVTKQPGAHAWLYGMKMDEVGDKPCFIEAYFWRLTDEDIRQDFTTRFNICGKTVNGDKEAILQDAVADRHAVTGLQVCANDSNSRVKGLKLWGGYIDGGGSGTVTSSGSVRRYSRTNCGSDEWKKIRDCPKGEAAVGFDVEYDKGKQIVGLALRCAKPIIVQKAAPVNAKFAAMEKDIRVKVNKDGRINTATINEAIALHRQGGVGLAIIENFKVTNVRTYGLRDWKNNLPANSQTLWQAASVSKMVASLGMVKAADMFHGPTLGRRVSKAAAKHKGSTLDDWSRRKFKKDEEPWLSDISVRRLLSHTAGLSRHGITTFKTDCPTKLRNVLMGEWSCAAPDTHPQFAPGKKWSYSGGGFTVAEHMLELASDRSAREFLNTEVLRAYGLTKSTFDTATKDMDNLARGCSLKPCGFDVKHTVVKFAGGLLVHPEELARLVIMLGNDGKDQNGKQVIPKHQVQEVIKPIWKIGSSLAMCTASSSCSGGESCIAGKCRTPIKTTDNDWYGLGVHLSTTLHTDGYPKTVSHSGSQDGFYTRFLINRATGNGYVILVNGKDEWSVSGVEYGNGELLQDIREAYNRHY